MGTQGIYRQADLMAVLSPWRWQHLCSVAKGLMAASLGIASEKIYKLIMKKTSVLKLVMIEYSFKNQILKSFDMPI